MTQDHAGNLIGDAHFQYQYDAWNRLTGVWYADGDMSQDQIVARYRYDGLSRRVWKQITNQGEGVVHRSDDDSVTGIQAGDRYEHYFYSGRRLVETTNHVNGLISGVYDYAASYVLNQFVYGTQYIDEPVRYDRNLQPSAQNRTCIGTGGEDLDASYFYHQDANYRVVMLTDEDGYVVERTTYTAYGEPTVHGGVDSGVAAELGNPLLVSSVGNPFMHQGLFRDRETLSYQNRFRQYDPRSGRFMQRDPLAYIDGMSLYEYLVSAPIDYWDSLGLKLRLRGTEEQKKKLECELKKLCPAAQADAKGNVTIDANADGANRPGCDRLRKLIDSKNDYVVGTGGPGYYRGGGARVKKNPKTRATEVSISLNPSDPNRWVHNDDGTARPAEDWELLYHELTHANHVEDGTWDGTSSASPADEKTTIEQTNELRKDYNANNAEGELDIPLRNPDSHNWPVTPKQKDDYWKKKKGRN